jgi:hypothetical protein
LFYIRVVRRLALTVLLLMLGVQSVLAGTPRPAQIARQIRATVKASRATVTFLTVDLRGKRLRLVVAVPDPPAYLKHRYERVVEALFPALERRIFKITRLGVIDSRSGRQVFLFTDERHVGLGGGWETAWHIDPRLLDCARALMLPDYEVDPDQSAPACPAS